MRCVCCLSAEHGAIDGCVGVCVSGRSGRCQGGSFATLIGKGHLFGDERQSGRVFELDQDDR